MRASLPRMTAFPILFFGLSLIAVNGQPMITQEGLKNASMTPAGELIVTPSKTSSASDFDFFEGKWKIHHRKLKSRLTHSAEWTEYDGTNEDFKMLHGIGHTNNNRSVIDGQPNEGVSLTLYNPSTRLWSIYWASSRDGILSEKNPALGSFEGNIGTFYAKEVFNGKPVLVMARWDKTNPDKAAWSQAFSEDQGKTWEWNWVMTETRVKDFDESRKQFLTIDKNLPIPALKFDANGELVITASGTSSGDDFNFLVGKWHMYHKRLKTRLKNSTEWEDLESIDENYGSILNGIGNTDLYRATFDGKPFEGFTLRLFNPATKLWSLYWVPSSTGILDPPVVGSFEGTIGHFFCKDVYQGTPVIVMFRWDRRDVQNPVWSQAFSADKGKTWEWNWINVSERIR